MESLNVPVRQLTEDQKPSSSPNNSKIQRQRRKDLPPSAHKSERIAKLKAKAGKFYASLSSSNDNGASGGQMQRPFSRAGRSSERQSLEIEDELAPSKSRKENMVKVPLVPNNTETKAVSQEQTPPESDAPETPKANQEKSSPLPRTRLENGSGGESKDEVGKLRSELEDARHEATQLEQELKVEVEGRKLSDDAWKDKLQELKDEMARQRDAYRHTSELDSKEMNRQAEQIQRLTRDLDKNSLQQSFLHAKAEKRALEEQNNRLHDHADRQNLELETVRNNFSILAQRLESTERESKESVLEIARLTNLLEEVTKERDRNRQEIIRLVTALDAKNAVVDVYYSDDVWFRNQFCILRGNIKDWAMKAFPVHTSKSLRTISSTTERDFDSISAYWDLYLDSDDHRPSFVQAFVWNYLLARVFRGRFWESSSSAQPYGRLSEMYQSPRDDNPEHQKLYHEWRSAGARLAAPYGTESHAIATVGSARLTRAVDAIRDTLAPWSTMGKSQSCDMLLGIVRDAVKLDLKMQQQKSYFALLGARELTKEYNCLFNPDTMEIRLGKTPKGPSEREFQLVIAPLLSKRGNSEGKDYNTVVEIEKAQVDIELPKKKKRY